MANTVKITLEVDDKGTVKIKQFGDESKKAFDQMQKGPLESLQASWVGLTAKITAATAVVYGVSKAFSSFVNEAAEAEQIENRLRFALETTGYTWQYAKQAVDQFANSVQASTRFSDEQARQALTDMMMYTNDFAKAQMGAKLAMDMSIRTGQDLGSTSRLIGMAMSGNVEMLGRYIPSLRNVKDILGENATATQLWEYALKELQRLFGGTAQADIDSYAGKLAQFKNSWSDFKEMIGKELLPPLKELLDTLKKITEEITKETPYKEIPLAKFWGMEITRRIPLKGEELQEVLLQRQRVAAFQSQKLAAEIKPDVFPDEKKKAEDLKLSTHWTIALWQAEDKYNEESRQAADFIERKEIATRRMTEAQDEWIDSLQSTTGLIFDETTYRKDLLSLQTLETRIAKEKELRDIKVSLGLMRPAEAGLAGLEDEKALITKRLNLEEQRLQQLRESQASLAEIYAQEDRITILKREQVVLDASRLRYVSETAFAYDGLEAGFKRYVTETGTFYTQLENMTHRLAISMESAFGNFFESIFDNTKSWKDKMKDLFDDLSKSFIKALSDMAAKALVTNLFGESGGKTNWGGIVMQVLGLAGGLLGGAGTVSTGINYAAGPSTAGSYGFSLGGTLGRYQHGGWINEPIEGIGRSGKRYTFGEAGPELVTPKSKLEGGSERERQPITIINVVDSRQLDQYLASSAGQNAVLNVIGSRAGEVRRIIS